MQINSKELMNMGYMDKLFDCVRLIDIQLKNLHQEKYIGTCIDYIPKFNYEDRQDEYNRCLLSDLTICLPKNDDNRLLLYIIFPVLTENKKLIMECILNLTKKIELNQICIQGNGLQNLITSNHFGDTYNSLHNLAVTDELTGAYNRRHINQNLPIDIMKCFTKKIPLSVLFADLDSFKIVNDLYGHEAGDYLLCEFVEELQNSIKQRKGWVARYGGDEFLLCLTDVDNAKAKELAEKIREGVEQKNFRYCGHKVEITCSIGVYTVDSFEKIPSFDTILREVDAKLYEVKKAGKNKVS